MEDDLEVIPNNAVAGLTNEYIDTRGVWPMYVKGIVGTSLEGCKHDISLPMARIIAGKIRAEQVTLR